MEHFDTILKQSLAISNFPKLSMGGQPGNKLYKGNKPVKRKYQF